MAVSTSGPASGAEPNEPRMCRAAAAPGRHQAFEIEPRYTPLYRVERDDLRHRPVGVVPPEGHGQGARARRRGR